MHRFSLLPSVVSFALASTLLPSPTAAQTKAGARVATMGGNFAGDPGVQVALVLSGDVGQFAGQCGALGGTDSLTGTLVREGSGPVADPPFGLRVHGGLPAVRVYNQLVDRRFIPADIIK